MLNGYFKKKTLNRSHNSPYIGKELIEENFYNFKIKSLSKYLNTILEYVLTSGFLED